MDSPSIVDPVGPVPQPDSTIPSVRNKSILNSDSPSIVDPVAPVPQPDTTTPQDESDSTTHEPELPKPWNIGDPFQYAPPKPEGDHWDLLLDPFVKQAQIACDDWKDEVQNLLIFAGLFSAVVTAFIIESYKNLQQNPNDVTVALLSHIALRLDGALNGTSTVPLAGQKSFSPSASAVRVNNLWFISLVLSLATVLVGIVSLQWLREYQFCPNLSSRQRYGVMIMRTTALRSWNVEKILTAMPILLQCALIIFLGGLIDFIHNLGDRNLLIPVTIVIAFTLCFIVVTTLLPTLQILAFYFRVPRFGQAKGKWANPPNPCPYKSTQSEAFRQLLRPIAILFHRLYPHIRSIVHTIRHRIKNPFSSMTMPALDEDDFTRYLLAASTSEYLYESDLAWLAIRDGYSRRAYGMSSVEEKVGQLWTANAMFGGRDNEIVPIYDIIDGLRAQVYEMATCAPAYYAFCEISELTLLPLKTGDHFYEISQDPFRQSAYLHDFLMEGLSKDQEATLTDIFDLDRWLFTRFPEENQGALDNVAATIIHYQNISYYLRYACLSNAPILPAHRTELDVRLIRFFCLDHPQTRDTIRNDNLLYPGCLILNAYESYLTPDFKNTVDFNVVSWQVSNVILLVLQQLDIHEHDPRPNHFLNNTFSQSSLTSFMFTAACFTMRSLRYSQALPQNKNDGLDNAVRDPLYAIFSVFEDRLNGEMLSWSSPEGRPTLVFYLAAFYVQILVNNNVRNPQFDSLLSTVCKYKRRTIDMGITDPVIEERLNADPNAPYLKDMGLFSPRWWQEFSPPSSSPPSTAPSLGQTSPSIVMYYPFSTSETVIYHPFSTSETSLPQD